MNAQEMLATYRKMKVLKARYDKLDPMSIAANDTLKKYHRLRDSIMKPFVESPVKGFEQLAALMDMVLDAES